MKTRETSEIVRRFNQAFQEHNPALLKDLIAPDCVMESIQPAPDGTRYEVRCEFGVLAGHGDRPR
jgi:hypothetical protein